MDALTPVLISLATARVTRLGTTDKITERFRVAAINRLGADKMGAYLIVCDWCMSIWIGAALTYGWHVWGESVWYQLSLMALSASYVAGFLNSNVED